MATAPLKASEAHNSNELVIGDCVSALLSLSSPKCSRSHEPPIVDKPRPLKQQKVVKHEVRDDLNTPRGVAQPSLDPGETTLHYYNDECSKLIDS